MARASHRDRSRSAARSRGCGPPREWRGFRHEAVGIAVLAGYGFPPLRAAFRRQTTTAPTGTSSAVRPAARASLEGDLHRIGLASGVHGFDIPRLAAVFCRSHRTSHSAYQARMMKTRDDRSREARARRPHRATRGANPHGGKPGGQTPRPQEKAPAPPCARRPARPPQHPIASPRSSPVPASLRAAMPRR